MSVFFLHLIIILTILLFMHWIYNNVVFIAFNAFYTYIRPICYLPQKYISCFVYDGVAICGDSFAMYGYGVDMSREGVGICTDGIGGWCGCNISNYCSVVIHVNVVDIK